MQFKEAVREQWAILTLDERAAIEALPQLLPAGCRERRMLFERSNRSWRRQADADADVQRRMREIEQMLVGEAGVPPTPPPAERTAAEAPPPGAAAEPMKMAATPRKRAPANRRS